MVCKIKTKRLKWLAALLLLVAAMVLPATAWADEITPTKPSTGEGTSESPYQITSKEELYWFAGLVNGTLSGVDQNKSACAKLINVGVIKSYFGWKYNIIGGVCGVNSGTIKNCFNKGVVNGSSPIGGVCGSNTGSITNCYYLSGTATGGINSADASGSAEPKDETPFKSGEMAYLLNEGKAFGTQVWGQQLEVNDYPVLGSDYKVIRAARGDMDANGDYPYWATFSNQSGDSDLGGLNVYTAKVSNGVLTITRCSDKIVAVNEGVLVKGSAEYLNAKMLNTTSATAEGDNDLVATPATAQIVEAGNNYTLYRLTYDDVDKKKDLGFYLGVATVDDVTHSDGTYLNATPNKAYLKVATAVVTKPSGAAVRGFVIPGNDGDTTGIECVSVTDESLHRNGNAEGIFDLQGRKVSKPTKGVYIKNNKLFLKLKN